MKKRSKELLKKVANKRRFLLNYHKLLAEHDPEMLEKWDSLYSAGKFKNRFLTARERELIDLGINAVLKWDTGLQIHIKKALDLGIGEKEITEVFSLIAMTSGIPCMIFAANVYADLKKRGFKYSFPQGDLED